MNTLKNISFFIVISLILNAVSYYLESSFLLNFLNSNLIIILLTLLAINTATTGLLSIKMAELETKFNDLDFKNVYNEMKFSLKEQIVLIIISLLVLIVNDSKLFAFQFKSFIIGTFLTSIFVYALDILRDTGVSVFDLLKLASDINKQK